MFMICPYCNEEALLIDSKDYYSNGVSYGMMYFCRPCNAYVGCHKNSKEHKPLGILANRELRELRKEAHKLFDPLWQSKKMARKKAYKILYENTGVKHIS